MDSPAARMPSGVRREAMALRATEEWVKRRLRLREEEEERLADVRSLFLPGSCEEKITHLGKSLKNFTRLKILDLSRNSLISLEGIQHLVHLEKLNLYYNNIAVLKDIFLLRNLGALTELDLRLNPVAKNEADYRLFIVHMLPNLRTLDDRPVRDSERKAALMNFRTDQAHEFHEYTAQEAENVSRKSQDPYNASGASADVVEEDGVQGEDSKRHTEGMRAVKAEGQQRKWPAAGGQDRPRHPRAEFTGSLGKKYSELDKDDEAVLNLIAKCNLDMNVPARITGSVKCIPEAELRSLQGIHKIDDARSQESLARNTSHATRSWPVNASKGVVNPQRKSSVECQAVNEDYQSLPNVSCPRSRTIACNTDVTPRPSRVTFADEKTCKFSAMDLNLKFQDEAEAYHRVTTRSHFTPHPGSMRNHSAALHQLPRSIAPCTSTGAMPSSVMNEEKQREQGQPTSMAHSHPTAVLKLHGGQPITAPSSTSSLHNQVDEPHVRRLSVSPRSYGPDRRYSDASNRCYERIQSIPCEALAPECPTIDQNFFNPNLMKSLLDLVDRYWNGFKSLHCNEKFLSKYFDAVACFDKYMFVSMDRCCFAQLLVLFDVAGSGQIASDIYSEDLEAFNHLYFGAINIHRDVCTDPVPEVNYNLLCLTDIKGEVVALSSEKIKILQDDTSDLKAEIKSLENCLCQQKQQYTEELEVMKNHLNQSMDDKNQLQNLLKKVEQKSHNVTNCTNLQVEELKNHNQQLCNEIDSLKHQAQCYLKIQELTDKLQESHRSLVCTNEHLLRELSEMRARHKADVDQLHWSYIQLKKSVEKSTRNVAMTGCLPSGRDMDNRRR
ncbi:centrosomal protein of 72 kDa [Leucoraja erinacea]|uniref:centrosomal protein of 72 kDa n=1 Tax=Leucoraja erinaceus TaxID=7782 RepID=UPI0024550C46|nr:centrosomal protein of 72 kDa [Leucoraja erinacea]